MSDVMPAEFYDEDERQVIAFGNRILATAVLCLIFVVALLLFIQLYGRYGLRRDRTATTVSVFRPGPDPAPREEAPKPGLDPSAIATLPTFPYRRSIGMSNGENDGDYAECAICLIVIEEGESVRMLPRCKHVFHNNCIDKWLCFTSTCPVCRAVVEPEPMAVTVEMGESSASLPRMLESSGAGGDAESTSESNSGSMSSLIISSFRRMFTMRPAERRTDQGDGRARGEGMEDLERQR